MIRNELLKREKEVLRMLRLFLEQNLNFVVVGGYAIATYKKRFSVDLDLVIKKEDENKFIMILKNNNYLLGYEKEIETVYGKEFKRFTKKIKGLSVDMDLLINGLVSRMTDAFWSFDYIKKYSEKKKLDSLRFLIPERELLIAMKFHSGRLADIRDIVALMPCDVKGLKKHIFVGNTKNLNENIKKAENVLGKQQFEDSFKGVFGYHVYKQEDVEKAKILIKNLLKISKNY